MTPTEVTTLALVLGPWLVWLAWEVVLLVRRGKERPVPPTISMTMRDRARHLVSYCYLSAGMLAHWFAPWRAATTVGSVLFWLIALALVAWDVARWSQPAEGWAPWERAVRWPPAWLLLGASAGLLLFPQAA